MECVVDNLLDLYILPIVLSDLHRLADSHYHFGILVPLVRVIPCVMKSLVPFHFDIILYVFIYLRLLIIPEVSRYENPYQVIDISSYMKGR